MSLFLRTGIAPVLRQDQDNHLKAIWKRIGKHFFHAFVS
jgi:hypothetical protein